MDQDAFRKTYRDINDRICLFEKSILSAQGNCSQAERFCLAEREGVHCRSDRAQAQCEELLKLLRQHARFTLKHNAEGGALPHGKVMRVQIGGLKGLYASLHEAEEIPVTIEDIHGLINQAANAYDGLTNLPFQQIIKQIAAYKGRLRRTPR